MSPGKSTSCMAKWIGGGGMITVADDYLNWIRRHQNRLSVVEYDAGIGIQ